MDLDPRLAPKTVNNFVTLARQGYYDGLNFHRVEPGFVIQGGCPEGSGRGGPGYKFEDEPVQGEYLPGAVAMANAGPDTNGSQFFICLSDLRNGLGKQYNLFGQVSSGMDAVNAIRQEGRLVRDGQRRGAPGILIIATAPIDVVGTLGGLREGARLRVAAAGVSGGVDADARSGRPRSRSSGRRAGRRRRFEVAALGILRRRRWPGRPPPPCSASTTTPRRFRPVQPGHGGGGLAPPPRPAPGPHGSGDGGPVARHRGPEGAGRRRAAQLAPPDLAPSANRRRGRPTCALPCPDPARLARLGYHDLHRIGLERKRAR